MSRTDAIPPPFGDLSKSAKDLFKKGFAFGTYKLDVETKSNTGVEFKIGGSLNAESSKMLGSFEVEKEFKDMGLKINEKWTTDNSIVTQVSIQDKFCKGSKMTLDTTFFPNTSARLAKLKGSYKKPNVHSQMDMQLVEGGPAFHGTFVAGYKGWMFGVESTFESCKKALCKTNFAIGFVACDYELFAHVNKYQDYSATYYHQIGCNTKLGIDLGWNVDNEIHFGVASKHKLDKNSFIMGKVMNNGQLGIGFQHKLNQNMELTMSSMIESKNFSQGGHQFGIGLKFVA